MILQLQVVEAAREQFHLDTTTQYELTHRGRVVDLSLPFRLTGISNNASMEMSIVTSNGGTSSASIVRVCVQLTNGKRVQQSVSSSITLEEMLYTLQLFPTSIQVCVGLRNCSIYRPFSRSFRSFICSEILAMIHLRLQHYKVRFAIDVCRSVRSDDDI